MVAHLKNPLGGHVGTSTSLLTLSNDALQDIDDLFVELSNRHGGLLLVLALSASFNFQYVLQGSSIVILKQLCWQSMDDDFNSRQEVLLYKIEQVFDRLDLQMCWFEHVRRTCIIIDHSNTQDFESHLVPQITSSFIIFNSFFELGNRVVVFIGELPPFTAQLTDIVNFINLKVIN